MGLKVINIMTSEDHYIIARSDGVMTYHRKSPESMSDKPLSHAEETIKMLCDFIMKE